MNRLIQRTLSTPVGALRLIGDGEALVGVYFPAHDPAPRVEAHDVERDAILDLAARELDEYFAGGRRAFSVPLAAHGTDFQRAVWLALAAIPYGERRSYLDIARVVGGQGATRAVGAANARNPLSIIVPCHRVVAASGALTGYGGGFAAKRWLLSHEGARVSGLRPNLL